MGFGLEEALRSAFKAASSLTTAKGSLISSSAHGCRWTTMSGATMQSLPTGCPVALHPISQDEGAGASERCPQFGLQMARSWVTLIAPPGRCPSRLPPRLSGVEVPALRRRARRSRLPRVSPWRGVGTLEGSELRKDLVGDPEAALPVPRVLGDDPGLGEPLEGVATGDLAPADDPGGRSRVDDGAGCQGTQQQVGGRPLSLIHI